MLASNDRLAEKLTWFKKTLLQLKDFNQYQEHCKRWIGYVDELDEATKANIEITNATIKDIEELDNSSNYRGNRSY